MDGPIVSQIECSSLARGDPDCNQYITGASGTVNVGFMSYFKFSNWRQIALFLNYGCLFTFCYLDVGNSIKNDLNICNWPVYKSFSLAKGNKHPKFNANSDIQHQLQYFEYDVNHALEL